MRVGQRYNYLVCLKFVRVNNLQKSVYLFRCDCGNEVELVGSSVKSGNTKSCKCVRDKFHITHGLSGHTLYQKWADLKTRCLNPNNKWYKYYGGKGVSVCDEWLNNFKTFYDWCLENGWSPGLSIDRIDSDKGYAPENCEFVTIAENSRRMRLAQLRRNEVSS